MRRIHASALAIATILLAATTVLVLAGETLVVQVTSTRIRRDARAWSPSLAALDEGARVEALAREGDWIKVQSGTTVGWLHASAVTTPSFDLVPGGGDVPVEASAADVSLGGKGFDEKVEAEYRKKNEMLDFATVDRLQTQDVSPDELERFLRDGALAEWGTP